MAKVFMGGHTFEDLHTAKLAQLIADTTGRAVKHHNHSADGGGYNDDACPAFQPGTLPT